MYGTYPEEIATLLDVVGESAMVLSFQEDRTFAALSLGRFGAVGSCRLDWQGAEVIERCEAFDASQLRRLVGTYAGANELAVLFWGNLAVPSVALEAALVASHAEAVLDCSPVCWIYLTDCAVLIEFQDGEGLTAAKVPHGRSRSRRGGALRGPWVGN